MVQSIRTNVLISDGVTVEIEGAVDGELKASQGGDAKLDCVVKSKF